MWKRRKPSPPVAPVVPIDTGITAKAFHMGSGRVELGFWVNGYGVRWMMDWPNQDFMPYHISTVRYEEGHDRIVCVGDLETECRRRKQQIQGLLDRAAKLALDLKVVRVEPC